MQPNANAETNRTLNASTTARHKDPCDPIPDGCGQSDGSHSWWRAFIIFLATLSGYRDAWISQLAAVMDSHASLDALLKAIPPSPRKHDSRVAYLCLI
jgi:hypothetical protein